MMSSFESLTAAPVASAQWLTVYGSSFSSSSVVVV
jgi:hypothetical protein